ncbi:Putative glycosyltransferase EpsE [Pelagimonas phthalicica]|uniref:Putative glycosyltransferase EpsE n=1 Tax=Pelagimonas phthalicica TaxID=1037362 RepID=A0A238J7X9_9RHOB|nr:glycosyltransferase [Pelagimonas phthalicica]TDS94652.1 glycosyl transferase family 2 [Pelagimonas phthalicica]SMX26820.1 Putative glycosyltransferase EpsE [Pelagimonas phthalicica]
MTQVQILMGVYEGAPYLQAQLQSLLDQSHGDWHLHVSDDSPTPESRDVIQRFFAQTPDRLSLRAGPRAGFAANFMSLIRQLPPKSGAGSGDMVAFADQDDVWFADKLARAVAALQEVPAEIPALYCARSRYWDGGDSYQESAPFARPPGFRNALIENIAQGNTIVLNPAAAELARAASAEVVAVFAHDWWLYQLIIGAGGQVIADNGAPVLGYRQHGGNVLGSGQGLRAQMARKAKVLAGGFRDRLDLNDAALIACQRWLTPENAALHRAFMQARRAPLPRRLRDLNALGLYRQRPLSTFGFWGASLIGRA